MLHDLKELKEWRLKLRDTLVDGDYDGAVKAQKKVSAYRIAQILLEVSPEHLKEFITRVPLPRAAQIIANLPPNSGLEVLENFSSDQIGQLIEEMPSNQAVDILGLMEEDKKEEISSHLSEELHETLDNLLKYDEGTVGAVMSEYFLSTSPGITVKEVLDTLKDVPKDSGNRSYIYVVGENKKLLGVVSLKELVVRSPNEKVEDAMQKGVVTLNVSDNDVDAAQLMRSRRYEMLPVIEEKHIPIGVLTLEDALEILEKRVAGQITNIGGTVEESFFTPPFGSIKKRLPWMAANVFLNLGAVAVIASFEDTIEAVAILAVFLPMITDMGGNVGIQSLSVSIRSLALGEVRITDYLKATKKEILIGLVNGVALGVLFSVIAYIMIGNPTLGFVAGTALAINVFLAGIIGGTLPFLIKKLGKDPAMMTGPVLTTITDITGVSIYLGLSTIFLASLIA